jgi:hypothetical protein
MLNVDRPQELFMPPQPQQPDPMVAAQIEAEKAKTVQKDKELELKALQIKVDADSRQKDREAKQNVEVLKLAASLAANPESDGVVDSQIEQMAGFLSPLRSSPPSVGSASPSVRPSSDLPALRPQRPAPSPVPPGLGGLMGLKPRSPSPFAMNGSFR